MGKLRIVAANDGLLDGRNCTTVGLEWDGQAPGPEQMAPRCTRRAAGRSCRTR